jgi:hypothetical protein
MDTSLSQHKIMVEELQLKCTSDFETFVDLKDPVTQLQAQLNGLISCLQDIKQIVVTRRDKLLVSAIQSLKIIGYL